MQTPPIHPDWTEDHKYKAVAEATSRFSLYTLPVTTLIHSPTLKIPHQTYSDYRHHETELDHRLAHFCADLHDYLTLKWPLTARFAAAITALEICHLLTDPCDREPDSPSGWETTRGRNSYGLSDSIVLDGLVISMLEMFEDLSSEERAWLIAAPMRMCCGPQSATIPYSEFGTGPDQTFGNNLMNLAWRADGSCGMIQHFPGDVVRLFGGEFELGKDSNQYYHGETDEEDDEYEDEGFVFVELSDEERYDMTTVLRFTRYAHEFRNILRNILDTAVGPGRSHPGEHLNNTFPAIEAAISTCFDAFEADLKDKVHIQTLINAAIALVDIGHTICDHPGPIDHMLQHSQRPDRVVKSLAWIFDKLFMKQRLVLARRPVNSTTFGRHLRALVVKAKGHCIMSGLDKAVNILLAPDDSVDVDEC